MSDDSTLTAAPEAPVAIVPADFKKKVLEQFDENFMPYIREKLAIYQQSAALVAGLRVTDATSLAVADAAAKQLLAERDALEAVRLSGPGALNSLGRELGKRFKPLFDALDAPIANLRHEIGTHLLAEKRKQAESYQAAAALHAAGDHGAAQVALAVASGADTLAPKGTSLREVWEVVRYEPELMILSTQERPGLAPDDKAIRAYLAKLPAGEEPALPGVICRLVPATTMRRDKQEGSDE